jgi:AcrR family transcriptional regulator
MPAVIDHDARRTALAEIAADLVANGGAEAATVRAVAAAAGFSTKAVTHYFPDKRALLAALLGIVTQAIFDPGTWTAQRQVEAIDEALAQMAGCKARTGEG